MVGTAPPARLGPVDPGVPPARTTQPVSVKGPALVVLGVAVVIIVTGVLASALVSGSTPVLTIRQVTIGDGTVVALSPAATALRPIIAAGEPPADILGNLAVPTGARRVSVVNSDQSQTQFDRTVGFTTSLSADQVVATYHTLVPRLGWQVLYVGDAARSGHVGTELLAKHGSGDGFYWEIGVVVSPATPAGVTPFTVELFQLPDGN